MTIADDLSHALADTYALLIKSHNYHWNITGPQFGALHELLEDQYKDLFEAADDLAERIRAIGVQAPGGLDVYKSLTSIKDGNPQHSWEEMVKDLAEDHTSISKHIKTLRDKADEAGDPATVSLYEDRMVEHDKAAWMLRSHVEG